MTARVDRLPVHVDRGITAGAPGAVQPGSVLPGVTAEARQ